MRKLIWIAVFIVFFLMQGSLWLIWPQWPSFDVLLPLIYFFSLMYGEIAGFLAGFFVGFLQDAMIPGFWGFHMFTRSLVGYGMGVIKERVFSDEYVAHIPVIGVLSMLVKVSAIPLCLSGISSFQFLPNYLWDSVGYIIMNMLLGIPVFWAVKKITQWVTDGETIYEAVAKDERNKLRQEYRKSQDGLRYKREYSDNMNSKDENI
ncbi:MAG: rod shape-determining protein MreD [bacterium]|nr:rod shape-determining protein MreD [Candidatus Phascolarctobacterium caballi]MCQ2754902.1 rod shape-determining protein MreD [bacterium]